jgi:hypothetical protein
MTMRNRLPSSLLRFAVAGLLGVAGPLLASCGGSGAGLIPVGNAGPLQSDFELVAQAAENGEGVCTATEAAVQKTEQDFSGLPSTVDAALRNRLHEGISKLRSDALGLCTQPLPQATVTSSTPKTTTSSTPKTTTSTTPTTTTPTTPTSTTPTTPTSTPAPSGPGGGTRAPGAGGGEAAPGAGSEAGGGPGVGENGGGGSSGAGANGGGQEAGK